MKFSTKIKNSKHGLAQRWFYLRNFQVGFSPVFLIPGSLREKLFGEHAFFRTLVSHDPSITLTKHGSGYVLQAGQFTLRYPKGCFYEGDFFDIIYPKLGKKDTKIERLVYENPFYESEGNYESFGATLNEGDYVVDAGANIGMFSVVASQAVKNSGKIFAFEPLTEITDILKENAAKNNCTNIIIENHLLGDTNKDVNFYYNLETNYNASSTTLHKDADKVVKLSQITLDDYVAQNNIEKINFIKADIEGAERDLLKGAEETIKRFKPKIAIRTYHLPDDPEVLYNLLKTYVPEYKLKHYKKTLYVWI